MLDHNLLPRAQKRPTRLGIAPYKLHSPHSVGALALLYNLHNFFSELGAKTMQTACAIKRHFQFSQVFLSESSMS